MLCPPVQLLGHFASLRHVQGSTATGVLEGGCRPSTHSSLEFPFHFERVGATKLITVGGRWTVSSDDRLPTVRDGLSHQQTCLTLLLAVGLRQRVNCFATGRSQQANVSLKLTAGFIKRNYQFSSGCYLCARKSPQLCLLSLLSEYSQVLQFKQFQCTRKNVRACW